MQLMWESVVMLLQLLVVLMAELVMVELKMGPFVEVVYRGGGGGWWRFAFVIVRVIIGE
jgi:hypothetical protein